MLIPQRRKIRCASTVGTKQLDVKEEATTKFFILFRGKLYLVVFEVVAGTTH